MVTNIKDISVDDAEHPIEQKVVEFLVDPDAGLQLREEFVTEIEQRLNKQSKRISHSEVMRRFA
ncbi:MAG: hypothetical protein HQL04_00090 [Nitrospirae bacterium]|nr:hypothetical protein [Nitrospirota bacterium]